MTEAQNTSRMPTQLAHSILAPQTLSWALLPGSELQAAVALSVWSLLTLQPTLHSGHKTGRCSSVRGGGHTLSPPSPCEWTYVQPCAYVWQNSRSELSLRVSQAVAKAWKIPSTSLMRASGRLCAWLRSLAGPAVVGKPLSLLLAPVSSL